MSAASIELLLAAAVLHVGSQLAFKRARNHTAFAWWMAFFPSVCFAPLLVLSWGALSSTVVLALVSSAFLQAVYCIGMLKALATEDLSVVYPMARGVSPVGLLLWSALVLGEPLTTGGIIGACIVVVGVFVINLGRVSKGELFRALSRSGPRWALLAGLSVAVFTLIDRQGIRLIPLNCYIVLQVWCVVGWQTINLMRCNPGELRAELRHAGWAAVISGITATGAYALVLVALHEGTPAGYLGAVREVSIVLGAFVAVVFLGERLDVMRVVGSVCIVGGATIMAILG